MKFTAKDRDAFLNQQRAHWHHRLSCREVVERYPDFNDLVWATPDIVLALWDHRGRAFGFDALREKFNLTDEQEKGLASPLAKMVAWAFFSAWEERYGVAPEVEEPYFSVK